MTAEPRSYYGQPILKQPTWTWEIPTYFFFGGMAGASATLAGLAELRGNDVLARRAWAVSVGALAVSPPLLISDLGRPARFLNMLRMFKVTSPMSVGTWVVTATAPSVGVSLLHAYTGRLRGPALAARPSATLLGLPLATYTATLIAQTAVPAWHEARRELPFVFASGAAVSAGAAATMLTPCAHAGPARRLAVGAAAAELTASALMQRRLGELAAPYEHGSVKPFEQASKALTAGGAVVVAATARRSRAGALAGGALLLAGAMAKRWSVYKAGFASAADPAQTVGPQRLRADAGDGHHASRSAARERAAAPTS